MSKIRQLKAEAKVSLPNSGETYVADDGTVSMVLADEHNEDYEPTDDEIREYGEWLGMKFPDDDELIWLAREGLKAPLPKEWKPCKTDTGDVYYFNFKTGDSIWDHPLDEYFKNKLKTEREKLDKKKKGIEVDSALSKLKQRTVFDTPNDLGASSNGLGGTLAKIPSMAGKSISSAASSLNNSLSSNTPTPTTTVSAVGTASKAASASTTTTTATSAALEKKSALAKASTSAVPVPLPASVEEVPLESMGDYKLSSGAAASKKSNTLSIESTPVKQTAAATSLSTPINGAAAAAKASTTALNALNANKNLSVATALASPVSATSIKGSVAFSSGGNDIAELVASPRTVLVSEAEKNMEVKLKAEMDSEHAAKVKTLEADLREELGRARRRHESAVEALKEGHQATVRKAVKEATDAMEDTLADRKRSLDQQYRKETEKLQDELDDLRAELRRVKASSSSGGGGGATEAALMDLERTLREQMNARIKAIQEEVDEIRDRHAKAKRSQLEETRRNAEEEASAIAAAAKRAAKADFEERLANAKAQHNAARSKLQKAHDEEIEEERERAARAGKGQEAALMEELLERQANEVRKIDVNGREELTALEEAHATQLRELKATMQKEIEHQESAAGGGGDAHVEVAAIEEEKRRKLSALREEHATNLDAAKAQRLHDREARLAAASNAAGSGGDLAADPETEIASIKAQIAAKTRSALGELEIQHDAALRRFKDRLSQLKLTNALGASEAKDAAAKTAAEAKLKTFIAETSAARDAEQREWRQQKEEILRQIATQEAAAKAAREARQTASVGTAKHAALLQAQQEADQYLSEQSKAVRMRSAEQRSMLMNIANDSTAMELKSKLMMVESEVRAEANRAKQQLLEKIAAVNASAAAVAASTAGLPTTSTTAVDASGLTDGDDDAPDSDDEAAVRATMMVAPLPDVDVEVRRRVAILNAEFEAKEQALRASFQRTQAVHLGQQQQQNALSRSTTPTGSLFQPPTIVTALPPAPTAAAAHSGLLTPRGGGSIGGIMGSDPIAQRIMAEQQELAARQKAVADARRQWESDMLASSGHHQPMRQQQQQPLSNASPQTPSTAASSHVDPNLVAVLMSLSSKLDTMNRRIDMIQQTSSASPIKEPSSRHPSSPHRTRAEKGGVVASSSARQHHHHTSSGGVRSSSANVRSGGGASSPSRQRTASARQQQSSSAKGAVDDKKAHRSSSAHRNVGNNPIKDTLQMFLAGGGGGF